ncbi:Uncharacterised protein [Candidatus Gugararchaeum adminiculabundum]|nr:Uncharacterised protein [Candidatus Gugararchaeum adminiculabundum]
MAQAEIGQLRQLSRADFRTKGPLADAYLQNSQIFKMTTGGRVKPLPGPSYRVSLPYEEPDQKLKGRMEPASYRNAAVLRETSGEMIAATTAATVVTGGVAVASLPASFLLFPAMGAGALVLGFLGLFLGLAAFLFSLGSREFLVFNNRQLGHVKPRRLNLIVNNEQQELEGRIKEAEQETAAGNEKVRKIVVLKRAA